MFVEEEGNKYPFRVYANTRSPPRGPLPPKGSGAARAFGGSTLTDLLFRSRLRGVHWRHGVLLVRVGHGAHRAAREVRVHRLLRGRHPLPGTLLHVPHRLVPLRVRRQALLQVRLQGANLPFAALGC